MYASEENTLVKTLRSPLTWLLVVVIAAAAGGGWWYMGQVQKRELAERERIEEEQAQTRRAAELEARRKLEQARFKEDIQSQKEAEEKQRQMDAEFRAEELKRKQFSADERPTRQSGYASAIDDRLRYEDARRQGNQQYEDREAQERARAEVERQKSYIQQREAEEEAARARRHQSSNTEPAPPNTYTPPPTDPPRVPPAALRKK